MGLGNTVFFYGRCIKSHKNVHALHNPHVSCEDMPLKTPSSSKRSARSDEELVSEPLSRKPDSEQFFMHVPHLQIVSVT